MANYTITRHTESGHVYGCTDFSTIQEEGQIASIISGSPLDATIVWDLTATLGYEVSVDDFEFAGATLVSANVPTGTYTWKDLPYPILGATMEQISLTLIRITLYLAPTNLFSGNAFVMPTTDIDTIVNIEGCAMLKGEGQHIVLRKLPDTTTTTRVDISEDLKTNLTSNEITDTRDEIYGILPSRKSSGVDEPEKETYLMSYQVAASDGYRYKAPPTLSFTDKNYYTKRRVTKEVNAFDSTRKDITSVSFDIYKKNN